MGNKTPLPQQIVETRLAGSGGQGLILAGLVLAEAAGVYDGREVTMIQSYGPEARGGASKAEVIISDLPIDYPLCTRVDLLLALTQEAADTHSRGIFRGYVMRCYGVNRPASIDLPNNYRVISGAMVHIY